MPELTLTKTRIIDGRWHGVLSGAAAAPEIVVTCMDRTIDGTEISLRPDKAGYDVSVEIPNEFIGDGVQTFLIADKATGATLASFALMAGEALSEDIRAEIDLLRAELDMLKRAFRRHCLETM